MSQRCALYARYSSDQQRDASIEDQLRICRARAEREGWTIAEVHADAAISGATTVRPGYQALLASMRSGRCDIVLAESLDRFSRDQEHIAGFHKQARFAGVRIVTLAEGDISELHVGLKGTMGALYLKDLADKTRRGLEGRIRAGRSAGSIPYGYRAIRRLGADGEPERGLREIDPAEAAVIRGIFNDYAAGRSPRAIARALNDAGVAGPGGGPWFDSTIRGKRSRGAGILRNSIYAGLLVWNRRRSAKDPVTGTLVRRNNDAAAIVTCPVPELRIVEDPLWQAVQARLEAEAAPQPAGSPRPAFWERRRPRYLLTGKVVCGACGSPFHALGRDYLGCRQAHRRLCRNRATVRRGTVQAKVLDALGRRLMAPELAAAFAVEFRREWDRLASEAAASAEARWQNLAAVERQIGNLLDAVADGIRAPGLRERLEALEARRGALLAEDGAGLPPAPCMPGNMAELYRARVRALEETLTSGDAPDALEAARALIDRVIVRPPDDDGGGRGGRLELVGDLAAMLEAAGAIPAGDAGAQQVLRAFACSVKEAPGGQRPPRGTPGVCHQSRIPVPFSWGITNSAAAGTAPRTARRCPGSAHRGCPAPARPPPAAGRA